MYWNCYRKYSIMQLQKAEPSHLMYWNSEKKSCWRWITLLNRHIWCIEMDKEYKNLIPLCQLNRHIWCIEMQSTCPWCCKILRWTVTFDVLKFVIGVTILGFPEAEPSHLMYWNLHYKAYNKNITLLNRHIWCIEMHLTSLRLFLHVGLNRHIWCIEIFLLIFS